MKIVAGLVAFLSILIALPTWYYLLYQVLVRVQATDLMFFLFWVYAPLGLILHLLSAAIKQLEG